MTAVNKPDLILRPKNSSVIKRLLLSCGMFVAAAIWTAQMQGVIGYLCAGFFALCILLDIVQLLPGSTYLRLAEDGLSFTSLFCVNTIPWNVIDLFFVVELKRIGMAVRRAVGFNFVQSYDRAQLGRRISCAVAQCEFVLPDTYIQNPDELAEVLNRCLAQFKAGHVEQSGAPELPVTPF